MSIPPNIATHTHAARPLNTRVTGVFASVRAAGVVLRDYQESLKQGVYTAWQSVQNVLAVLPTGGGKTVVFASVLHEYGGASVAIAHRQELVSQISLALARCGVRHRIIAQTTLIKSIIQLQVEECGFSFYDPSAPCTVAGVDTLTQRAKRDPLFSQWTQRVGLWVMDEAHHVLRANKWGKAVELFPNARGLGVTATPTRADGCGLGLHADGVFGHMVEGPAMRDLITRGYLTEYRVVCAPSDIQDQLSAGDVSNTTGDYKPESLRTAAKRSHIVGDVVDTYIKWASGKLGITFATDVETATQIANQFKARGVPAEVVSAKTPDKLRVAILRRFKRRELMQLVNVDLFGEGFDLPAIEVVSFARPTASYGLYAQQFGRALRPMPGKEKALIIDHVGNVVLFGPPDAPRPWTLDRREKRARGVGARIAYCVNELCAQPYERFRAACPYCGTKPQPKDRSAPEFVEGDLVELTPEALAKLRGEVAKIDGPAFIPQGATPVVVASIKKNHKERQTQQEVLRSVVRWWAGLQQARGLTDSDSYRLFYQTYGIDVLSAQALGRTEAHTLAERIAADIGRGSHVA